MNTRTSFRKILILCSLVLASQVAMAADGGSDRGGVDNSRPEDGAMWFPGNQPIKTCMTIANDFGVGEVRLKQAIKGAADVWAKYISTKEVSRDIRASLLDSRFAFSSSRLVFRPCDGSEDLKFYFGTSDLRVKSAEKDFDDPLAFVHRTSFDSKTGRGKGFVWVTSSKSTFPNWTLPSNLNAILIHEWGHILGCEHVEDTIMTAGLATAIRSNPQPSIQNELNFKLNHIDWERELVPVCSIPAKDCRGEYNGGLDLSWRVGPEEIDPSLIQNRGEDAFKLFVGRPSVGPTSAKLIVSDVDSITLHLQIRDQLGMTDLALHLGLTHDSNSILGYGGTYFDNAVFKILLPEGVFLEHPETDSDIGTAKAANGVTYGIQLNYNESGKPVPLVISYYSLDGLTHGTLFASIPDGAQSLFTPLPLSQ